MSKLIKLTDEVGNQLEAFAKEDSISLAGEVKLLLDLRASTTSPTPTSTSSTSDSSSLNSRLDSMAAWLEKRFAHLESLIEDTTVDRVAATSTTTTTKASLLPWENCIQDIYDDFPNGSDVWLSGVREAWGESDSMDMASYFVKNGEIWSNFYGHETPLLRITPELTEYLQGKGFAV